MKSTPDPVVPKYVGAALDRLNSHGFEAYLVGGCVRDLISGRKPSDYDIATPAYPGEVMRLFKSAYPSGIKHGTVTVRSNGYPLEITTYRKDGIYSDGRRPDSVSFSSDITEDLRRRDFTINAMAWNKKSGLIDPYCGQRDLDAKLIRCVGNPQDRFFEDPLRIIRAWRFSATLGFDIERETLDAANEMKERLSVVSPERVCGELCRMLLAKDMTALLNMINNGFLERFGVKPAPPSLLRLKKTKRDLRQRAAALAVFLERAGSIENATEFLLSLRFDKKTTALSENVRKTDTSFDTPFSVKKAISQNGPDAVLCAASVFYAITGENVIKRVKKVQKSGDCLSLSGLRIDGGRLKKIGITDGEEIGRILKKLLLHVLAHPEDNRTEKLTVLAKNLIQ